MIMKSGTLFVYIFVLSCYQTIAQGRIGINTTTPQAMLHIKDSSVLFSSGSLPGSPGNPPASGSGIRMMWYPQKAAFRAGEAGLTTWDKDSIGNYSFASGFSTKAKGVYSFAAGELSEAPGTTSISMGRLNKATGDYSVSLGRQQTSSGDAAVTLGYGNNASAIASTAIGYFNTAEGSYSTALGFSTRSVGQMSLSTGYDTEAEGIVSFAGGYRSKSTGSYSFAAGFQTNSLPFASMAIGRYNIDTIGDSNTWVSTDPVFVIGNGEDAANRNNAFTVLKNGKTAINGSNPAAALSIKGFDGTELSHLQLIDNNTTESAAIYYTGHLIFKNTLTTGDYLFRNSANTNVMTISNAGNVTVAGVVTENSDARLKTRFKPIQSSLTTVASLKGYHYYWKDELRDQQMQTGFIAQDVELLMPELVKTSADGIKSVNYSGIIPYLAEAIKELKVQNEQLKKEIEQIKQKR